MTDENKNNVVDMNTFRKRKDDSSGEDKEEKIAVMSDRYAFRIRADGIIETLQCEEVISVRPATDIEKQLVLHNLYMETKIVHLIKEYAPHLIGDDYNTYPFVDWDEVSQKIGPEAVELNQRLVDDAFVLNQRAVHVLVHAIREEVKERQGEAKVGTILPEGNFQHRDITSDITVLFVRIHEASCLAGTHLKAEVHVKAGYEDKVDFEGMLLDIEFASKPARVRFLEGLLCEVPDVQVVEYIEKYLEQNGNGSLKVIPKE